MATAVATAVVRLAAMEVAVEVTTDSMPPMSLVMRDWTSPVRVRVKNAIDCRCRWPKTLGAQPVHDVLADLGADPGLDHSEGRGDGGHRDHADAPARPAAARSWYGRAVSMTARSRNGEASPTMRGGDDDGGDDRQRPTVGGEQPADAAQGHVARLRLSAAVTVRRLRPRPALLMSRSVRGDSKGCSILSQGPAPGSAGGPAPGSDTGSLLLRLPHYEATTP